MNPENEWEKIAKGGIIAAGAVLFDLFLEMKKKKEEKERKTTEAIELFKESCEEVLFD